MAPQLRRIRGEVADRIRTIAIQHPEWGPSQVFRTLEREFGQTEGMPSSRTVQRFMQSLGPGDRSDDWSLAPDDQGQFQTEPEDVAVVLDVLRWVIDDASGSVRWPTRALAAWVVRIKRAYPDLNDPKLLYHLAAAAVRGAELLFRVQLFLAYTPWRDAYAALFEAVKGERVPNDVLDGFGELNFGSEYASWRAGKERERRKESAG